MNDTGSLCITLKESERVFIGTEIVMTVRIAKTNRVTVSFLAPKSIKILREAATIRREGVMANGKEDEEKQNQEV